MAVVLAPPDHGRPHGPARPVVPAPFRSGAYFPAVQAGPGLDRAEDPRSGGRGPVDLADHRRLRPAPAGPDPRRRPPPALAAARPGRPAHARQGPPRIPQHPRDSRLPRWCTKTRQTRPRQATRTEEPPPAPSWDVGKTTKRALTLKTMRE